MYWLYEHQVLDKIETSKILWENHEGHLKFLGHSEKRGFGKFIEVNRKTTHNVLIELDKMDGGTWLIRNNKKVKI